MLFPAADAARSPAALFDIPGRAHAARRSSPQKNLRIPGADMRQNLVFS